MEPKVSEIVQKYLDQTGLSLRAFADKLGEGVIGDGEISVTHASVHYWLAGRNLPSTDFLTLILIRNKDWRFSFAMECLIAKRPEVWGVDGIWQLVPSLLPVAG